MPSQMAPFCSSSRGGPISSAHGSRWLQPWRTLPRTDKTRNYQRAPSPDLRLPLAPVPQLSAKNAHTFPHLSLAMLRHRAADKGEFQSVFSSGNMSWFFFPPHSHSCQWPLPTGAYKGLEIANQFCYPWSLWPLIRGLAGGCFSAEGIRGWRPWLTSLLPRRTGAALIW